MSSLLQHRGKINRNGVGLIGYLSKPNSYGDPLYQYQCHVCGRIHPCLLEFFRKPVGMFGNWVVFRYYGTENVPDLSVPIWLDKGPPKNSRLMSEEESSKYWHSE